MDIIPEIKECICAKDNMCYNNESCVVAAKYIKLLQNCSKCVI